MNPSYIDITIIIKLRHEEASDNNNLRLDYHADYVYVTSNIHVDLTMYQLMNEHLSKYVIKLLGLLHPFN